ncbi:hypothetical protein EO238_24755, partial [Citrobacter sp. AAK_AS5]
AICNNSWRRTVGANARSRQFRALPRGWFGLDAVTIHSLWRKPMNRVPTLPASLAAEITQTLSIPTIGIGAGAACDGQVLVIHDLLGITPGPLPRFVKQY